MIPDPHLPSPPNGKLFFLVMWIVPFSRNGDFLPQWIRKGMTPLPSGHSLLDFILQVNARSDGELNVVMFWDSWMLTSSSLTTRARSLSSPQSLMMPSAMTPHFTIPPKTVLRMISTLGWAKSSLNIEFTWASFIKLLRSRRLGGGR